MFHKTLPHMVDTTGMVDGDAYVFDAASGLLVPRSVVQSIVEGDNVSVDNTDPLHPIVSAAGGTETLPASIINAKGDLIVGLSDDTPARKAVGADETVLTADASQPGGMKWAPLTVTSSNTWSPGLDEPLDTMTGLGAPASGTWSIVGGVLNQSNASGTTTERQIPWGTPTQVSGGINAAEVETRWNSGSGSFQRMGLYIGNVGTLANGYALVYVRSSDGTNWTLNEEVSGVSVPFTSTGFTRSPGTWMRLSVLTGITGIKLYLDGVLIGSVSTGFGTVATTVSLYTTGVNADFRNLRTWDSALNVSAPF